jgi:predicted membrane metal-binding protein
VHKLVTSADYACRRTRYNVGHAEAMPQLAAKRQEQRAPMPPGPFAYVAYLNRLHRRATFGRTGYRNLTDASWSDRLVRRKFGLLLTDRHQAVQLISVLCKCRY